ncbi:MAG: hypothetical protein ACOWWH_12630 [Eubacteriaceae bacterium]
MADFTPSNLVKGQALFNQRYKSGEWRIPDTAALSVAFNGEKANPMFADLRKREDRSVSGYFPTRKAKSAATARAYNHTGTTGDSLESPITWQTSIDTFSISLKQNDNNIISYEENWAAQMQNTIFNILTDAESKFITNLIADRTQVNVNGTPMTWDGLDYVLENAIAEKDHFFQYIKANMNQNLYKGQITVVADSLAGIFAAQQVQQGSGNATNLGWQFQNMNIAQSTNSILSGLTDTYVGAALAFPTDLVGIVPWIPKQNRKPLDPVKAMSYNGDFGQIDVPIYDAMGNIAYTLPVAIHMYAERADASGSNGSAQDVVMQVELSLDTAYVSAPLSAFRGANDSVVYGYGQKSV